VQAGEIVVREQRTPPGNRINWQSESFCVVFGPTKAGDWGLGVKELGGTSVY
jgi:hypothetical protein